MGGASERVGTAGTSGLQQILPDGRVLTTEDVRRKETFGNVSHYAGALVVAEDHDDTGVAVRIAGGPRLLFWDGKLAHAPRGAADGAGLYAITSWPEPGLLVFDAQGAALREQVGRMASSLPK